ncbi:MAG: hypothetical protein LBK54_09890 [Propionibacteriaceae bacterium]|jgi:hypothetical protein|nr:hypothetical protein [Propionibacteriaceae bacterium]
MNIVDKTGRLVAGALGAALVAAGLLTACSSPPAPPSPYAQDFAEARARAGSDFILSVLADDKIEAVELRQAQDHYIDCLAEAGIQAWYADNGYGWSNLTMYDGEEDTQEEIDADIRCHDLWVGDIESLYWDQIANPDKRDWNSLVAACFVRHDLAPAGFSGRDYAELLAQITTTHGPDEELPPGTYQAPEVPPPTSSSGVSLAGMEATSCMINPQL